MGISAKLNDLESESDTLAQNGLENQFPFSITTSALCNGCWMAEFCKIFSHFRLEKILWRASSCSKSWQNNNCGIFPFSLILENKSCECFPSFQWLHYSWSFSSVFGRNKLYFYVRSIEAVSLKSHRNWIFTKVYKSQWWELLG